MMDSELKEAIVYFKQTVMHQVMDALSQKYYHYGEFKGTINKSELKDIDPLLSFLGINSSQWQKNVRFKVEDFILAYNSSKFSKFELSIIIENVTGNKLVIKKVVDAKKEILWRQYFSKVKMMAPRITSLLLDSRIKSNFKRKVSPEEFSKAEVALNNLPQEPIRLPVFSYQLFNDPHFLDGNSIVGGIFLDALEALDDDKHDINEVYAKVNIIKDDILNFVTVQNILGDLPIFKLACESHLIWNVPLMQLMKMKKVLPNQGKKIFLIENSSVYAIISDKLKKAPLIMTSGQFKFSTWKLLELLPDNVEIFYSSDMDSSGLLMAQKLIDKYGQRIHLFGMSAQFFLDHSTGASNNNDARKNILKGITNSELLSLKSLIQESGLVVYQEAIIPELIESIEDEMNIQDN